MAKPAAQTYVLNMNATPSRFQHPVDAPDPVAARYYSRFLVGENPAPTREQATHLAASLSLGDPLADAWMVASQGMDRGAAHAMVTQATRHGISSMENAPPELRALFEQLESVPLWVDPRYLEIGCRAFRRTGPLMGLVLSGFSLMGGYRSSAVVKTLMMTGKLKQTAGKRLVDTGRFVLAVTEPGGVAIGKPGYESAIHVRLLHAMIRNKLRSSPDWRTEEWGLPINQADMLGTNLLFSLGYLIGCRELGMKFSAEEAQGVVHLWRYVGYLLGIDESLIPATEREAARAMYMVGASQPPADADSISLAQALHEVPMQRATSEREKRLAQIEMGFRAGVSRMLLGNDVANDLKLPNHPLQHGAKLLLPIVSGIDSLRRLTPFGDEIAYRAGDAWIRYGVKKLDEWEATQRQPAKH
jgi:hypothetical protein